MPGNYSRRPFQEEDWPGRIDDPLCPNRTDPQQRLHDTVRALNRHQLHKRIRFSRDGTGEGVVWKLVHETHEPRRL